MLPASTENPPGEEAHTQLSEASDASQVVDGHNSTVGHAGSIQKVELTCVNVENERPLGTHVGLVKFKSKVKGVKLLPHEQELVGSRQLEDITHAGASSIWLSARSTTLLGDTLTLVYRPVGDVEYAYLLNFGILPDTQPYQTIVEGDEGRTYAEKYLRGHKSVDSSPTTVLEFLAPRALIRQLFAMQSKNEDGAISHGLGSKGGRGLPLFNASLQNGDISWRIVFVKRFEKRAVGAFGAGRKKV